MGRAAEEALLRRNCCCTQQPPPPLYKICFILVYLSIIWVGRQRGHYSVETAVILNNLLLYNGISLLQAWAIPCEVQVHLKVHVG